MKMGGVGGVPVVTDSITSVSTPISNPCPQTVNPDPQNPKSPTPNLT